MIRLWACRPASTQLVADLIIAKQSTQSGMVVVQHSRLRPYGSEQHQIGYKTKFQSRGGLARWEIGSKLGLTNSSKRLTVGENWETFIHLRYDRLLFTTVIEVCCRVRSESRQSFCRYAFCGPLFRAFCYLVALYEHVCDSLANCRLLVYNESELRQWARLIAHREVYPVVGIVGSEFVADIEVRNL